MNPTRIKARRKWAGWGALLLTLTVRLSAAGAAADSWPEFRGPTGQGISAATNLPVNWSATSNVVWKASLPGNGWSSPVLAQGVIYVTAAVPVTNGDGISLRLFIIDAATGEVRLDQEVIRPEPGPAGVRHQKNSQCSATPILDGGRLYVHFGHLGTAALDLSGKVLWRQTTLNYPPLHGNGGSPALVGDELIFSCDGLKDPFVVALDARTGEIRWRVERNTTARSKFSFCTPLAIAVGGARQVILPGSGFVAAYDPADGREFWKVRYGEGYSVVPRPVYAHGLLYIATGFDKANLLAIDPQGARGDVTETKVKWKVGKGVPMTPSLLAVGGELYFVSDGGIATCLDAVSGEAVWSERLGGDFSASPFYAEGRIYFLSESGVSYVVRAGRQFELLAKNELGERTLASCAVTDNAIFLRSEGHLWRLGSGAKAR